MSRAFATALALAFVLATALPVAATDPEAPKPLHAADAGPGEVISSDADPGEIVPGEVVVKWRDSGRGPDVARARGLAVVAELGAPGKGLPWVVSTGDRPVEAVVAELNADPAVEYAEPNYVVTVADEGTTAAVAVNDPQTGGQYSLNRMRVRDAWARSTGGSNVVAVLDTGVQAGHKDLSGRVLSGYDFVSPGTSAADDNGHGTWVAGIIAAKANDSYGIAGISWSDKILPVKIMNSSGTGSTSNLTSGIVWSANQGADVINMSVGGFPYSKAVEDAVNYAWSKGAVLVGAAGNNNRRENFYPASYANVISVSATQVDDEFSHWSSYGPKVEVSAPGSSVLTTNCTAGACPNAGWGSHTYISGTSFATPNVAGVVALIKARYPSYSPSQIVNRLYSTVDDLGAAGRDERYGRGRVNAYRALGASVAQPARASGDALESNNTLGSAKRIPRGTTTRPSIHPAGDADVFAVDIPRAGRLDVRVTGVVDSRAYPWNKSTLPIDPIVELYSTGGTLIKRVDQQWESGTELAQHTVGGPARILVRITNYYANGNKAAYSITPTFVDTVAPAVTGRAPGPNDVRVRYDGAMRIVFSEPVTGVSGSTVQLRTSSGAKVPASVSYSASKRRATLKPKAPLAGEKVYRLRVTSGITDQVGHALAATSWTFTTGKTVPRLAGDDRFATAAIVSASVFAPSVPVVYVATGMSFPDALAAGPAARTEGGPLLLATRTAVPPATKAELTRLKPGRIVVVGGVGAVSDTVFNQLRSYTSGSVTRRAGADRFATAAAISRATFRDGSSVAYIATGADYPDALSAGAVAAGAKAPILLARQTALPDPTIRELERLSPSRIVVMGGPNAISDGVVAQLRAYAGTVTRVSGADRYATSVGLSGSTFSADGPTTVYVATGRSFPDGLSAGPVAGRRGSPLLLVPGTSLPAGVAAELKRLNPTNVVIVGGPSVVTETVRNQIRAVWP